MRQAPFETPRLFGETFRLPTVARQIRKWNAELPERFWRVVRKYGWWGAAYRETVFRLADHAQSAAEQEPDADPPVGFSASGLTWPVCASRPGLHSFPLTGLNGSNPLAFLAALGALRILTAASARTNAPEWLSAGVRLSWTSAGTAQLHFARSPSPADVLSELVECLNTAPADPPSALPLDLVQSKGVNGRARS